MKHRLQIWVWMVVVLGGVTGAGTSVCARPFRVAMIPNGTIYSCSTCHEGGGGGPRNTFGVDVESGLEGSLPFWNAALAALDSDQDGYSNGEELGDADGDGIADPTLPVSHPGEPLSYPVSPPELDWVVRPEKTVWNLNEPIRVRVDANDRQGIQVVSFEWSRPNAVPDLTLLLRDREPPYEGVWQPGRGLWLLSVSALDARGARSVLPSVSIFVGMPDPVRLSIPVREGDGQGGWSLSWSGGVGPYAVQGSLPPLLSNSGHWEELVRTSGTNLIWAHRPEGILFRVVDLGVQPGTPDFRPHSHDVLRPALSKREK